MPRRPSKPKPTPNPKTGRPLTHPDSGPLPLRAIRVPDSSWEAWRRQARREGLPLAEWIRRRLDAIVGIGCDP